MRDGPVPVPHLVLPLISKGGEFLCVALFDLRALVHHLHQLIAALRRHLNPFQHRLVIAHIPAGGGRGRVDETYIQPLALVFSFFLSLLIDVLPEVASADDAYVV